MSRRSVRVNKAQEAAARAAAENEQEGEPAQSDPNAPTTLATDDYNALHGMQDGLEELKQWIATQKKGKLSKAALQKLEAIEASLTKSVEHQVKHADAAADAMASMPENQGRKSLNDAARIDKIVATRKAVAESSADNYKLEGTEREAFVAAEMARTLAKQVADSEAAAAEEKKKADETAKKALEAKHQADKLAAMAKEEAAEKERARKEEAAKTRAQLKKLEDEAKAAKDAVKAAKEAAKAASNAPSESGLPENQGRGTKRKWASREEKVAELGEEKVVKLEDAAKKRADAMEKRILEKHGVGQKDLSQDMKLALDMSMKSYSNLKAAFDDEAAQKDDAVAKLKNARAGKKAMQNLAKRAGASDDEINAINAKYADKKGKGEGSSSSK